MNKKIKYGASIVAGSMLPLIGILQAVNDVYPIEHIEGISQILLGISSIIAVFLGSNTITKLKGSSDKLKDEAKNGNLEEVIAILPEIVEQINELQNQLGDSIRENEKKNPVTHTSELSAPQDELTEPDE